MQELEPSISLSEVVYFHLSYDGQTLVIPRDEAKEMAVMILQHVKPESVEK
jgi:hypothetical protein